MIFYNIARIHFISFPFECRKVPVEKIHLCLVSLGSRNGSIFIIHYCILGNINIAYTKPLGKKRVLYYISKSLYFFFLLPAELLGLVWEILFF